MLHTLVLGSFLVSAPTLACDGKKTAAAVEPAEEAVVPAAVASNCAKKAELMGTACSYTTGMMAQRVLAEGKPYSYTGHLVSSANALPSKVAAPFTVGPEGMINVVANEIVERLAAGEHGEERLVLSGKLLDLDGVQYFVLTRYQDAAS